MAKRGLIYLTIKDEYISTSKRLSSSKEWGNAGDMIEVKSFGNIISFLNLSLNLDVGIQNST